MRYCISYTFSHHHHILSDSVSYVLRQYLALQYCDIYHYFNTIFSGCLTNRLDRGTELTTLIMAIMQQIFEI